MTEDISCGDALDQLWALIDNELCTEDADRVQQHLDRCGGCYPQYDFHSAYRQLVAMQCRQKAPPELRRKLFLRLLEEGD